MYNLNQLKTFIKVAELGSFNKAAEEEFISPNAVMMQINNLEIELGGVKLFNRSKRGNKLTHAGELLYKDAKKILNHCETSKKLVMDAGTTEDNTVRIAVTYGSSLSLFDDLWKELHKRYPEIRMELFPIIYDDKSDRGIWSNFNEWTDVFLCFIDEGQTEANGITEYGDLELGGLPLTKVPLYCMVNHNHRLADYEELKLSDLSGEHVAILSSGWGKYADQLKSYIEENFEDINLEIRPYFGAETYNECANGNLVLLGGFDSASVHPFIKAIPFVKDKEIGDNYIGFVYVNPPSAPIEKFVNAVSEIVKDTPEIVKEF